VVATANVFSFIHRAAQFPIDSLFNKVVFVNPKPCGSNSNTTIPYHPETSLSVVATIRRWFVTSIEVIGPCKSTFSSNGIGDWPPASSFKSTEDLKIAFPYAIKNSALLSLDDFLGNQRKLGTIKESFEVVGPLTLSASLDTSNFNSVESLIVSELSSSFSLLTSNVPSSLKVAKMFSSSFVDGKKLMLAIGVSCPLRSERD
jgi:hypothetical protein